MPRGALQDARALETSLLLLPLSFVIASLVATLLALGVAHSLRVVSAGHYDVPALTRAAAVVLGFFPLYVSWTLGVRTVREERYDFDVEFWAALACSGLSVQFAAKAVSPLAILAMLPVWFFIAHLSLLQWRLRQRTPASAPTR